MSLWLLCCVLLFVTSRGYAWLSHQSWFLAPELSLPWLVLGGMGLAIASNRAALRAFANRDAATKPLPSPSASPSPAQTASAPATAPAPAPPSRPLTAAPSTQGRERGTPRSSISF